jgi:Holliday junction DNA helicase RuvB
MEFYSHDELVQIIRNTSKVLKFEITDEAALEIAKRARGTPRIANRLTRLVRDYSQHENISSTKKEDAVSALELFKVDPSGLEESDKLLLRTIIERYDGGPVGVETLAATMGEERQTIEDCYEPFLLQAGFLTRTSRGRMVTEEAYKYLGYDKKDKRVDQLKII